MKKIDLLYLSYRPSLLFPFLYIAAITNSFYKICPLCQITILLFQSSWRTCVTKPLPISDSSYGLSLVLSCLVLTSILALWNFNANLFLVTCVRCIFIFRAYNVWFNSRFSVNNIINMYSRCILSYCLLVWNTFLLLNVILLVISQ